MVANAPCTTIPLFEGFSVISSASARGSSSGSAKSSSSLGRFLEAAGSDPESSSIFALWNSGDDTEPGPGDEATEEKARVDPGLRADRDCAADDGSTC